MDDPSTALIDPASVLLGLAAVCGLFAATYWLKVARSVGAHGMNANGAGMRSLAAAAAMTALAFGLASLGYLLGRFTGRF